MTTTLDSIPDSTTVLL